MATVAIRGAQGRAVFASIDRESCGLPRNFAWHYRLDFICFGAVVVELKALRGIGGVEMAQTLNYLRASGLHRALILNFGSTRLEVKRLVMGTQRTPDNRETD